MPETKVPSHPRDVQQVLDSIRVKEQESQKQSLMDSIAHEPEDPTPPGEGRTMQSFLAALPWVAYTLAIVAAAYMAWSTGLNIVK